MYCIDKFSEKEKNYKLVSDLPIYQDVIDALKHELEKVDKGEIPNNIYFWCDTGDLKEDFANNLKKNLDINIVCPVNPLPTNEEMFELQFLNNNKDKDKKSILLLDFFERTNETCLKLAEKYLNKESREQTNMSKKWVIFALGENPFDRGVTGQGDIFNYTKYFKNYIANPTTNDFLKYAKNSKSGIVDRIGIHPTIINYLSKNENDLYGEYNEVNAVSPYRWESFSNDLDVMESKESSNIYPTKEDKLKGIEISACGSLGNRIGEKFYKSYCEYIESKK